MRNTNRCLANSENYTCDPHEANRYFPLMWIGVRDFRENHSDNWFIPSVDELKNYVYPNKSRLKFDANTGGSSTDGYWSSSEADSEGSYILSFGNGKMYLYDKSSAKAVRLCRDF